MDMIHIREGSRYDGYFEKVAQRISEIMTDEIRETILRLKYETPETEKINRSGVLSGSHPGWGAGL